MTETKLRMIIVTTTLIAVFLITAVLALVVIYADKPPEQEDFVPTVKMVEYGVAGRRYYTILEDQFGVRYLHYAGAMVRMPKYIQAPLPVEEEQLW